MIERTRSSLFPGAGDRAVFRLDIASAMRDGVLMLSAAASLFLAILVAAAGLLETPLGLQSWRPWIPTLLALTFAGAPGGPAMIFGSILIEEKETGVGAALAATPTPRIRLAMLRIGGAVLYNLIWLPIAALAVLGAWPGAYPAPTAGLALVIVSLALLGAAATLVLARLSANRIEALAMFKAMNVFLALPCALFLGAQEAWWRPLLQALPTGPALEALYAFDQGATTVGLMWAAGAALYSAGLLGLAVAFARR